jgi:hypothetical protein
VPVVGMSWPVRVSEHALEQAADRAGVSDRSSIAEQVAAALEAGRVSADRPTWLDPRNHSSTRGLYTLKDPGKVGGSDAGLCPGGRRCSCDVETEEVLR